MDALGGPFAVVAAMQLLTHVANPLRVLREASRVAVPGGTLVASVWGREQECDVRAVRARRSRRGCRVAAPPAGPPTLTDPDRLRKVAWLAGLAVAGIDEVVCTFDYPDEDARARARCWRRGSGGRRWRGRARDAVRRAVRERLRRATGRRGAGTGCENLFRVLVAHAP